MPKRGEVTLIESEGTDVVDIRAWARLVAREVLDQHQRETRATHQTDRAPALHELPKAG